MALFPQRLGFGHFWPKQVFSLVAFSPLPTTCCSENGWGPPFRSGSWVRDVEATESVQVKLHLISPLMGLTKQGVGMCQY